MGKNVGVEAFVDALASVEVAAAEVRAALAALDDANAAVRRALDDGIANHELLSSTGWADHRAAVILALGAYSSELKRARAEYVRVLVDGDGFTISDDARVIGHPRQLTKRIYDTSRDGLDGGTFTV